MKEKMINNKKIINDVSIFILIKYIFLNEISIFEVIFMGFPISVVLVLRENLSHRNTQWISVRNYGFLFEIIDFCSKLLISVRNYFNLFLLLQFDYFWLILVETFDQLLCEILAGDDLKLCGHRPYTRVLLHTRGLQATRRF